MRQVIEMAKRKEKYWKSLVEKYPPSEPCACKICLTYCARPGWWTVEQATRAIKAGYSNRMMLEIAPELTFGVLSPAFKGCEKFYATNQFAGNGCTFLKNGRCEIYGTGYQPLECRFCHHNRRGLGLKCHADLEKDWHTPNGQILVEKWIEQVGLAYQAFFTINPLTITHSNKQEDTNHDRKSVHTR
jgi:hypothetical protein